MNLDTGLGFPRAELNLYPSRVEFWLQDLQRISQDIVVNTRSGKLRGFQHVLNGKSVFQFLGVPYAEPPVGSLRFKPPLPISGWTGTKNATDFGPECMQNVYRPGPRPSMSEDCLVLHVYVPETLSPVKQRAVMVWIHGGAFVIGKASTYDGAHLALRGDVIVVTINYRLGVFGFLSTGDTSSPGNYGLLDQRLAIKWVKDNIEKFGGNSSLITIFGESAGGVSTGMHVISPQNVGLFQRAIVQSGNMLVPWAIVPNPLQFATKIGSHLSCSQPQHVNTSDLIRCIQKRMQTTFLMQSLL